MSITKPRWKLADNVAEADVASALAFTPSDLSTPSVKESKTFSAVSTWSVENGDAERKESGPKASVVPACKHGWKPVTMKKRVLVPLALWTMILAAVIEYLAQRSSRKGGLALSESLDDMPMAAEVSYMFLPTLIAVLYSLAWNWVDLDVKRIQPWLDLSKPGGAKVEALSLDYPFDFIAFVPFIAAKRRHWLVFISGTVMMVIFWAITPLQGAIFGTGPVTIQSPAVFAASSDLIPAEQQSALIDSKILHRLYATKYLGQEFPPFTTPEYALRPFQLAEGNTSAGTPSNWTGTTTKFWTDLECRPAESVPNKVFPGYYDFLNGQGCNASEIMAFNAFPMAMAYLGWHSSAHSDQFMARPTCTSEFSNQFLAILARREPGQRTKVIAEDYDMTALFCTTSYWKQEVQVTVSSETLRPDNTSIVPKGPVEKLLTTEFNNTGFEYMLGSSVSAVQDASRDYAANLIVDQYAKVNGTGLNWPLSPLVGFVIGGKERPVEDYLDETLLAEGFRKVHQAAFVHAYDSLLSKAAETSATTEGSTEFIMYGILVSRLFAAIVEGLLLAVGASALLLAFLAGRKRSNLGSDPATLGDVIDLLQSSPDLSDASMGHGGHGGTDANANPDLETTRVYLQHTCRQPGAATEIRIVNPAGLQRALHGEKGARSMEADEFTPVKPFALRQVSGALVVPIIAGCLVALVYLRAQEQRLGGLPRPTENFEVLQILENYIPTAIATGFEPFWVLVNRFLCIFQPYKDLSQGKKERRLKRAITAKYAALPPQLSIWSALRSGHFLLASVCLVSLLSNALAVGLGGLFNEKPVRVGVPTELQRLQSHELIANELIPFGFMNSQEIYFPMMGNITLGTTMPPWISPEFYFQPFAEAQIASDNTTEEFQGRTQGLGIDVNCTEYTAGVTRLNDTDVVSYQGLYDEGDVTFRPGCSLSTNLTVNNFLRGDAAAEGGIDVCGQAIIFFWSRATEKSQADRKTTYLYCRANFRTAQFDLTVGPKGHVREYKQATEFTDNLGYDLSANQTGEIMYLNNRHLSARRDWHNETISMSWFGEILKGIGGEQLLDPSTPLPEISEMEPLVKDIYKRSFSYLLGTASLVSYAPIEEDQASLMGVKYVTETRIFLDTTALLLSATVLGLYIIVAAALYGLPFQFFLPRMPTTIAAVLEFMGPSRALQDYGTESRYLLKFGSYIGRDGLKHVGIEHAELVMPLGRTSRKGLRFRKFWRRNQEEEG